MFRQLAEDSVQGIHAQFQLDEKGQGQAEEDLSGGETEETGRQGHFSQAERGEKEPVGVYKISGGQGIDNGPGAQVAAGSAGGDEDDGQVIGQRRVPVGEAKGAADSVAQQADGITA
ncbi:hypothetical protein B5E84_10920 [Lachnoclostridium sp. An14]|nr:hypothetical protein B5E84_10920 [Lachnoclostridium sp. An14]